MASKAYPDAGLSMLNRSIRPLIILLSAMAILACIGCAPSLRYTRFTGALADEASPKKEIAPEKQQALPAQRLKSIVDGYLGVPYREGGMNRYGLDCSGFVCRVYREVDVKLPHSSRKLAVMGRPISRRNALPGDLVFFKGGRYHGINHVGIYMGDNQIIHASRERGITYASLNTDYFRRSFAGIRRIYSWQ